MKQRRMDYHLHTLFSPDGAQSVEKLCDAMLVRGVEEICLTDHMDTGTGDPMWDTPPAWDLLEREVRQAQMMHPALTIRMGLEMGDSPAGRQLLQSTLADVPFDFCLLSLHLVNGVDCYQRERYYAGKTRDQAYREYAEAKAESVLSWQDFDSVAHIGYVSRYSPYAGEEKPLRFIDAPDAFDAIFRHVIGLGKAIEINTAGDGEHFLPDESLVRRYIELGGERFTFGSDAHTTDRDYDRIEDAKAWVRALGGKYQAAYKRRVPTLWAI